MREIEDGLGLIAFPIGTRLRQSIPSYRDGNWRSFCPNWKPAGSRRRSGERGTLATHAADMEKVAGIGKWDDSGLEQTSRRAGNISGIRNSHSIDGTAFLRRYPNRPHPFGPSCTGAGRYDETASAFLHASVMVYWLGARNIIQVSTQEDCI